MKVKIVKDETSLRVFKALKRGAVSGKNLSKELNVSRTAVWKAIEKIKSAGYAVRGVRGKGYVLISSPEFPVYDIAEMCECEEFYFFDVIDSTNTFLKRLLSEKKVRSVAIALKQTAGRGRLGREWISDYGGLYFSTCFPLKDVGIGIEDLPRITLTAGVAVCKAIREITPECTIKWPNDVMLRGKKVSGILCELCGETEEPWVIVGVGVNVKNEVPNAANLKEYGVEVADVCKLVILKLKEYLRKDWRDVRREWLELTDMIGKRVRINSSGKTYTGVVRGIDERGALILESNGETVIIFSGDCFYER